MFDDADKKYLETMIDQKLDQKLDEKLDSKLKPINKSLKKLQKDLTISIKLSEIQHKQTFQRLANIEDKLGIDKPDFLPVN